jgi:hypothetical protein
MRARLVPILVLGLLGLVPAALARQMDARDFPRVSGPLTLATKECDRKALRAGGSLAAVVKSCLRFYRFNPARETNPSRNYGAIWLQTNVDGRNGWCATVVKSDIRIPDRSVALARRPRSNRTARPRGHRTFLPVDANDNATSNAFITRWFRFYPRSMRGMMLNEGRKFRTLWYGSAGRKLAFASGVEISWRRSAGQPQSVSSALQYKIKKKGIC